MQKDISTWLLGLSNPKNPDPTFLGLMAVNKNSSYPQVVNFEFFPAKNMGRTVFLFTYMNTPQSYPSLLRR